MKLLHAEWQRFFARRFTRIMLGLIALVLVLIAIGVGHQSHKLTPADYTRAHAELANEVEQTKALLTQCQQANGNGPAAETSQFYLPPGQTCEASFGDPSFTPPLRVFLPDSWVFDRQASELVLTLGGILALFGFAVGASAVGAEWSSGGMANLLLWRPRRLAVLGGKLSAVLLAVLVSSLGFLILLVGLMSAIAGLRGSFGHVTSGVITSLALSASRPVALGLVTAVIGFAIASIGRSTAGALGIGVGYVVLVEGGGLAIASMMHIDRPERFLLSRYVAAWLEKKETFNGPEICTRSAGGENCFSHQWLMHMSSSAEVIGIIALVLIVWAGYAMQRRDVAA